VRKVDLDGQRVEFENNMGIADLMGNPISVRGFEFDPAWNIFPAELQIGKRWSTRFRRTYQGSVSTWDLDMRITNRERVAVPAGDFEAFKIEGRGFSRSWSEEQLWVFWVVPGLNFAVKRDLVSRRGGNITFASGIELLGLKQHARG
jgi:hypothetical protein